MSFLNPPYHYTPLPSGSIRLLCLLPHEDENAHICCKLFNYSLDNSAGATSYEALSYTWGPNYSPHSIFIDGYQLPVGENLFNALLHLRDRSVERILWIDAICINQQDTREKGVQVQSMTMIYAMASSVIVWLGKATDDIDLAFQEIELAVDQLLLPLDTPREIEDAILRLLEAPWFQWIWILQEVAAARHILVKCGHAEIDGNVFFPEIIALELRYEDQPNLRNLIIPGAYLAKNAMSRPQSATNEGGRFSLNICPLGQLVDMFHRRQATDRRDKIYALLGMSSDDPSISGLSVNYDIGWAKLFQQLINFIFPHASADTWNDKEVAVIRGKGHLLGRLRWVHNYTSGSSEQGATIVWDKVLGDEKKSSEWRVEVSAEPLKEGDVICRMEGARMPTIIRMCGDYWKIILITASPLAVEDIEARLSHPSPISPQDLLLIWDWNIRVDSPGPEYEKLIGDQASKAART